MSDQPTPNTPSSSAPVAPTADQPKQKDPKTETTTEPTKKLKAIDERSPRKRALFFPPPPEDHGTRPWMKGGTDKAREGKTPSGFGGFRARSEANKPAAHPP